MRASQCAAAALLLALLCGGSAQAFRRGILQSSGGNGIFPLFGREALSAEQASASGAGRLGFSDPRYRCVASQGALLARNENRGPETGGCRRGGRLLVPASLLAGYCRRCPAPLLSLQFSTCPPVCVPPSPMCSPSQAASMVGVWVLRNPEDQRRLDGSLMVSCLPQLPLLPLPLRMHGPLTRAACLAPLLPWHPFSLLPLPELTARLLEPRPWV